MIQNGRAMRIAMRTPGHWRWEHVSTNDLLSGEVGSNIKRWTIPPFVQNRGDAPQHK